MFSAFQTFGRLGAGARAVSAAWSPLALWPNGIASPGMWMSPRTLDSQWQDYTGTTPVSIPGTVADTSNPVGLALDIRAGATVLTDPGNHLLQATSTARPLVSARVNLLTYTEDFTEPPWYCWSIAKTVGVVPAPDGSTTASLITESVANSQHLLGAPSFSVFAGAQTTVSWYVKDNGVRYILLTFDGPEGYSSATFDLVDSIFVRTNSVGPNRYVPGSASVEMLGGGWSRVSATFLPLAGGSGSTTVKLNRPNIDTQDPTYLGDGVSGIFVWRPQVEYCSAASVYQPILTDGSTYPATGFPIFQKYDGTDDGMATASFAAGTLSSAMDCMIAVRRDSASACVAGLYNGIADATKFFGMAESGSGSGCVGSGAGAPTVWVDGTQLAGGTAVTRGTLHTALTVGDVHILEFRGLDLSTWAASGFGLYTGYLLSGALGDILLYPSTASTEDKDAARQWLADYYGVTLA